MQTARTLPVRLPTPLKQHRLVEAAKRVVVAAKTGRGLIRELRALRKATEELTGESLVNWIE
jgi:hypothetical protein